MTTNPFTFGNPIQDPTRFYGRKQEIRQIVNRLLSSAHESTSIVGERRIGKTSLLYYMSNPDIAAGLGLASDKFCLVYIDFQGLTDIAPQRFWQRVLSKMAHASCDPELANRCKELGERSTFDLFDLEDLFAAFGDHRLNVICFLDEFEYVTENRKFGSDFFGGLRALAIHYPLSLVPATRRELVDLCHSDELKGSPFFNIFANIVLRPFARAEAEELVDGYTRDAQIALLPDEKELILGLSGQNPFFLQMAGYYAMEGKQHALAKEALGQFVVTNFDQQAKPHHNYTWTHCSESERITLLTLMILARQEPSPKSAPSLENLTRLHARAQPDVAAMLKRGLLEEKDGAYLLFSPSFERWITLEITAPAGEQENQDTVEEWLDQWIKRESRDILKPIKGVLPQFKKTYWPLIGMLLREFSMKLAANGAVELIRAMK